MFISLAAYSSTKYLPTTDNWKNLRIKLSRITDIEIRRFPQILCLKCVSKKSKVVTKCLAKTLDTPFTRKLLTLLTVDTRNWIYANIDLLTRTKMFEKIYFCRLSSWTRSWSMFLIVSLFANLWQFRRWTSNSAPVWSFLGFYRALCCMIAQLFSLLLVDYAQIVQPWN